MPPTESESETEEGESRSEISLRATDGRGRNHKHEEPAKCRERAVNKGDPLPRETEQLPGTNSDVRDKV